MPKIMTCLWFDMNAEEAVKYYTGIFKNSKVIQVTHYSPSVSKAIGIPAGAVLTILFQLDGQKYIALNGGPGFKFSEAVSLIILCKTQKEVDYYWRRLAKGGQEGQCGWLKDKSGFSWQVAPAGMQRWISDKTPRKDDRVLAALLPMKKLILKDLERAYKAE